MIQIDKQRCTGCGNSVSYIVFQGYFQYRMAKRRWRAIVFDAAIV